MGNLLGTPVTDKETHTGTTKDEGLKFGLSSMQGWRVHMEDAHIAEGDLYALKEVQVETTTSTSTTVGVGNSADDDDNDDDDDEGRIPNTPNRTTTVTATKTTTRTIKIPLPGHALFAVFDGHGGTFAAMYSGKNFLRILSHQKKFVEYAELVASHNNAAADDDSNNTTSGAANSATTNRTKRMEVLEQALKQAFIETDYEVALAIRGTPHRNANQEYHTAAATSSSSLGHGGDNNNNDDGTADTLMVDAVEAVASRAAAEHVSALDDEGDSGTTACMVMITPDALVCANAGDSRAIFCRKANTDIFKHTTGGDVGTHHHHNDDDGNENDHDDDDNRAVHFASDLTNDTTKINRAIALSYDHKPDDAFEERRIRLAGGYVAGGRVEGDLAVSRGLGDFRFKHMPTVLCNTQIALDGTPIVPVPSQSNNSNSNTIMPPGDQKVSPIPDVTVHTRDNELDQFVIVACDGIWDVRTNQDCVMDVARLFQEGETDFGLLSEELLDECLRYGSKDNMTVIVIQLPGLVFPDKASALNGGMGVMGRRQKRHEIQQRHNLAYEGGGGGGAHIDHDDDE